MFASHLVGPAARPRQTALLAEAHHDHLLILAEVGRVPRRGRVNWDMALQSALRALQSLPAGLNRLVTAHGRSSDEKAWAR